MPASYREYPPDPALRPFVECYWTREERDTAAAAGPGERRVLPDGCADIIFSLGDTWPGPSGTGVDRAYAVGTMTRPLLVPRRAHASFTAVRFRPGGVGAFLKCPAAALTDQRVPLAEVWGSDAATLSAVLEAADAPDDRVRLLERALLVRLVAVPPPDPLVGEAVRRLAASDGRLRVDALSDALGVTRQHLARGFARHVGVTPKGFARIVRLRGVLRRVAESRPDAGRVDWAGLAYEFGYYDQSHLVADFREIAGQTPEEFLGRR